MWTGAPFTGTKIALLCGSGIVAYQRDEKPGIPFPGLWDLPGGGREGGESPVACALREVEEEFGLSLDEDRIRGLERYESGSPGGLDTYFCVADVTPSEIAAIRFGGEGQRWRLMPASDFLALEDAVPHLQIRLRRCLESRP